MQTHGSARSRSTALPPGARYALRLILAAALLALVFSRVPIGAVLAAAAGADPVLLALAFGVSLLVHLIASARLRIALASQRLRLSLWAVYEINLAARFYNLFLPGGTLTGMAVRVFKVNRLQRDVAGASTAVFADRLIVTVVLCALGIVFWLLVRPSPDAIWLWAFLACTLGLGIVLRLVLRPDSLGWLRAVIPAGIRDRWAGAFRGAANRSERLGGSVLWRMLALAAGTHAAGIVCYWLVLSSLSLGLSGIEAGWVRSVLLLVTLLPISLAGLGVREAGAFLVLRAFGVEAATAVTFSLLVALVSIIGTGLVGGLLEAVRFLGGSRAIPTSQPEDRS